MQQLTVFSERPAAGLDRFLQSGGTANAEDLEPDRRSPQGPLRGPARRPAPTD